MNMALVAVMPGPGWVAPSMPSPAEQRPEEQTGQCGAQQLHDDVAGYAPPGEVTAGGEGDADRGVQVRARHGAHEEDDRHDHEPRRGHGRRAADGPVRLWR